MSVVVETDNAVVVNRLGAAVATDPVRHTLLSTIREEARTSGRDAWLATDGVGVAARSPEPQRPVALSEGWQDLFGLASALAELEPLIGLGGPVDAVDQLVGLLDRPVVQGVDERLFRCDRVEPPVGVTGSLRRADSTDSDLIVAWREPYLREVFGRVPPGGDPRVWAEQVLSGLGVLLWLDADGSPVSMAAARVPVDGVARIGPVYTPPEHRGHGYAAAVTAALTADVLARGAVPVLFTDLANPTSNGVYQRIGFRTVGDRRAVWLQ